MTFYRSHQIIPSMLLTAFLLGPLSGDLCLPQPVQAGIKSSAGESAVLKVSVNRADTDELMQLSGIGEKTAQNIIRYRQQHGPFRSIEDLKEIKGIGGKRLEQIRRQIRLD